MCIIYMHYMYIMVVCCTLQNFQGSTFLELAVLKISLK